MGSRRLKRLMHTVDGQTGVHTAQFFVNYPLKQVGEYRLMLAVLEQAYVDIHPRGAESASWRNIRLEAKEWFKSPSESYLYDFASICSTAGFNTRRMRERALEMLRGYERVTLFRQEKRPAYATQRTKREEKTERRARAREVRLRGSLPRTSRDV